MNTIAIVGRPNVGKSSLFNILSKSRSALVSDLSGLTRDRNYTNIFINNTPFLIIDTGGIDDSREEEITYKIQEQTSIAIDESEIIFFIVDARVGIHPNDEAIAKNLRKKNKEILLIINKSEGKDYEQLIFEFKKLGFKNRVVISASHREGISQIDDYLTPYTFNQNQNLINNENKINISFIGKPNVGKSTLINSILGEDRFIAYNKAGTTRDSISVDFDYNNKYLLLTDTAGIRKKGRVVEATEKFSVIKSILAINQSNVSILVIDSIDGLNSQDLQILGYIIDHGKPLVICFNKWDKLDNYQKENLQKDIEKKFHFFKNYEIFFISALKNTGFNYLIEAALRAFNSSMVKIKTPLLNKFLKDLLVTQQPPIIKGIRPKLKYIHQGSICPPTFIIHGNHLQGLKKDYIKFIESTLLKIFNIKGTPINIQFNEADNPFEDKVKKPKKIGLVTKRKIINQNRKKYKNK